MRNAIALTYNVGIDKYVSQGLNTPRQVCNAAIGLTPTPPNFFYTWPNGSNQVQVNCNAVLATPTPGPGCATPTLARPATRTAAGAGWAGG